MKSRLLARASSVLFVGLIASPASAELLWQGDFETGDFSQWTNTLDTQDNGLSIVSDPVLQGTSAAKVEIDALDLWENGLNRVEVQYQPDVQYTADGGEIYFGYSVYVPEALTTDNHQIGYWETTETWQQVMQLWARGTEVGFATQKPSWTQHWSDTDRLTPGEWHRIVWHVVWSANATEGEVSLWWDGEQVVQSAKAQTYLDKPSFTQLGILRDTIDEVEVLYIDDARAGTTLADVQGSPTGSGGAGGSAGAAGSSGAAGGAGIGGAGTGGAAGGTAGSAGSSSTSGGSAGSGGGSAGTVGAGAGSGGAAGSAGVGSGTNNPEGSDGCGCRTAGSAASWPSWLAGLALGLAWWRRREGARTRNRSA